MVKYNSSNGGALLGLLRPYCVSSAPGRWAKREREAEDRGQFGEAMQSLRDGSAGARKAVRAIQQKQFGSRGFFGGPAPR